MKAFLLVAALSVASIAWPACQLNNPAPVTPDYPPEGPIGPERLDAGRG